MSRLIFGLNSLCTNENGSPGDPCNLFLQRNTDAIKPSQRSPNQRLDRLDLISASANSHIWGYVSSYGRVKSILQAMKKNRYFVYGK